MSVKRALLVVLVASAVMLAVGIGPGAHALPQAQEPDPPGLTIPYPGRLDDESGQPVADGAYDFTFALYETPAGGESLWSEVQEGVAVQEGAFNALLGGANGVPMEMLDGGERWLEVAVRGPGEAGFTALAPRQRLSPAAPASPSAGPACEHDHWGETWNGSGAGLVLEDTGGNTAMFPALIAAVFGDSDAWGGVWGRSNSNIGVLGESTNAHGVHGSSTNDYGGWFESGGDHFDIGLGGDVGRINAAESGDSQLYLSSNADMILKLDNDGGEDHTLRIKKSTGEDLCTVDEVNGNLNCTGSKSAVVETSNHGQRLLYAVESPEVWFEDFGSASLAEGATTVAFDPIFAETVNLEEDYHVFVTPLSQEPVLLFVTDKSDAGFTVQGVTLDGEPAACAFDYRVVAKRLGYEDMRLEETTWQESE